MNFRRSSRWTQVALAASGGGSAERGEVVQRPARHGRQVGRRKGVTDGPRVNIDGDSSQRLRRDGVRRRRADEGAIDAAANTAVVVRLHQPLRLEHPQVVEHPLARHAHGFGDLRRRLRPLEQMKEPQPNRL